MPVASNVFAHTSQDRPWEPLENHLAEVAALAKEFAEAFQAGEWAEIAGRCHDLGKASQEFQQYIRISTQGEDAGEQETTPGRVNHSSFGCDLY